MEQDIFCRIASGAIPGARLYEDAAVVAFRDINPQAPLHVLIIPKKHFASLGDMGEKEEGLLGHMVLVARRLAEEQGVSAKGYRIAINVGPEGGQVVPHLHLHLLGGRELAGELG